MILPDPPILVITDRAQCAEPLEDRAVSLFRGGCRWLSLREKDIDAEARLALLKRLVAIGGDFGATVGVHADLAAARHCKAALHLPASADLAAARHVLGPHALIGQSCHDVAELDAAAAGADYATLGPVAQTSSKRGYRPTLAPDALAALVRSARLPVLALGGVTAESAAGLIAHGFAGVAVMGEPMRAADPVGWFAGLAEALGRKSRVEVTSRR